MNPLTILFYGLSIITACQCHSVVINRCCGPPLIYDEIQDKCVQSAFDETYNQSTVSEFLKVPSKCVIVLDGNNKTQFRVQNQLPVKTCTNGNHIQTVVIPINASGCSRTRLTSRGQLRVPGNNRSEYYSPREFCVIGSEETSIRFRVCNATCSNEAPCIRKCCPIDKIFDLRQGGNPSCVRSYGRNWKPQFYSSGTNRVPKAENDQIEPHYIYAHPSYFCERNKTSQTVQEQRDFKTGKYRWMFHIGVNSNLFYRKSRYHWGESSEYKNSYCVDGTINSLHASKDQPDVFDGNEEENVLVICIPETSTFRVGEKSVWELFLLEIILIFSCISLFVTLVVYAMLWHRQKLYGWTLMSYCASLFLMYFFFFFEIIFAQTQTLCAFVGVAVNFFYLSTFCWTTMISFNLWSKFRVLQAPSKSERSLRRYLVYAGICTTIPLTIVTIGLILDSVYLDEPESNVIIPEYGEQQCGVARGPAEWAYQQGPAGSFVLINLVFFASTVNSILKAQKGSNMPSSSKKERLKISIKLLVIMGILYVFEWASFLAYDLAPVLANEQGSGLAWYWLPCSVVFSSQGILIFIIFTLKRDIFGELSDKYAYLKRFMPVESDTVVTNRTN